MDSAVLSLLGAFLLSIIGLFVFIWSMRKGLLVENPKAASVIFARGEIGKVDDPALDAAAARFHAGQGDRARLEAVTSPMPTSFATGSRPTRPPRSRCSCSSPSRACGCWLAPSPALSPRSSCTSPTGW